MKKILAVTLFALMCLNFAACNTENKENADQNEKINLYEKEIAPYENLLFSRNITWGISKSEMKESINNITDGVLSDLTNRISVFYDIESDGVIESYWIVKIDFKFFDKGTEEFEDQTELVFITYEIRDRTEYEDRTKEIHGNMDLEYLRIKDYLSSEYGDPFLERSDEKSPLWISRAYWETGDTGICLTLQSKTSPSEIGKIELKYTNIEAVKSPWYADR